MWFWKKIKPSWIQYWKNEKPASSESTLKLHLTFDSWVKFHFVSTQMRKIKNHSDNEKSFICFLITAQTSEQNMNQIRMKNVHERVHYSVAWTLNGLVLSISSLLLFYYHCFAVNPFQKSREAQWIIHDDDATKTSKYDIFIYK